MFLILGNGLIAEEYIKCLITMNIQFEIIGNTKARNLEDIRNLKARIYAKR